MSKQARDSRPSSVPDGDAAANQSEALESALRNSSRAATDGGVHGPIDQVERGLAEIERAAATLRRGQPALETWNASWARDASASATNKPRPVWLLIGLLWFSTALVTVGAVAAIARLAG